MQVRENELIIKKIMLEQLCDQIRQIKIGLLNALDEVECADKRCNELKGESKKQLEEIN